MEWDADSNLFRTTAIWITPWDTNLNCGVSFSLAKSWDFCCFSHHTERIHTENGMSFKDHIPVGFFQKKQTCVFSNVIFMCVLMYDPVTFGGTSQRADEFQLIVLPHNWLTTCCKALRWLFVRLFEQLTKVTELGSVRKSVLVTDRWLCYTDFYKHSFYTFKFQISNVLTFNL